MVSIDEIREALIAESKKRRLVYEHAQQIFAKPYSGHDSEVNFHQYRGEWYGVGIAIEVLDRIVGESEKVVATTVTT